MSISTMTYAGIMSPSVRIVFRCSFRNFFPAPQSQPVVPSLAEAVARSLVFLGQFVAFQNLRENSFHRKIIRIDDRVGCPNSSRVMRIARGSHGQTTNLCILEGVAVVATERCCRVEHLDRVNGQRFQSGKTNASPE